MSSKPKTAAIVLAAGRGQRMGDGLDGPKQYEPIGRDSAGNRQTVLSHALNVFLDCDLIDLVLVVIHPDDVERYGASAPSHPKLLPPVPGGQTRQKSGLNGLVALEENAPDRVLIHDAARPFLTAELIGRILDLIDEEHCALPALPVSDTVKATETSEIAPLVTSTLSRDNLYLAQTPQGFVYRSILDAHLAASREGLSAFTDDCAVSEWAGTRTRIAAGEPQNFKITTIDDLEKARKLVSMQDKFSVPDIRTGIGYDVHRLVPGDGVILCGIKLPSHKKLDGHSDADVALHALTDALLGTISDGDIGNHFPPSDPVWSGAASDQFLSHACSLVREKSGVITHLDVTIVCEEPKIGPHRNEMRARVADICAISVERVSIKATTHEKIGTIGRSEGIAAMATASVVITA